MARDVSGQERPLVVPEREKRVQGVAVGADGGAPDRAVLVGDLVGFDRRLRTSPHRFRKRPVGIVHLEDDVADAVAVLPEVIRGGMIGRQRRRQDEARPPLLERVRCVCARRPVSSPL